jgi:O-acetyl-ADP-ribose deacetylase (regulator of RNase III)
MMTIKQGNIFDSECETIVIPVNCVGIAGKGLALSCAKQVPNWLQEYRKDCVNGLLKPGMLTTFQVTTRSFLFNLIVNFPTKVHWKNNSKIEDIECGLNSLVNLISREGVSSIALPPIGCGLGKLDRLEVYPLIEQYSQKSRAKWVLYDN